MSSKLFSSFAILPVMFLFKYVDVTNPDVVNYIRIGYGAAVALSLLIYAVVYFKITQAKDQTQVNIKPQPQPFGQPPVGEHRTITAEEYDQEELMKAVKQTGMGLLITAGIVYKFELVQPLFFQAFMTPKTVLTSPLVQIYLFGRKPEGELKRPFKAESPFGALFGGGDAEETEAAPPVPATETKKITASKSTETQKSKPSKKNAAAAAAPSSSAATETPVVTVPTPTPSPTPTPTAAPVEEEKSVVDQEKPVEEPKAKKDKKDKKKEEKKVVETPKTEEPVEMKEEAKEEAKVEEEETPAAVVESPVVDEVMPEESSTDGTVRQRKKKSKRDD